MAAKKWKLSALYAALEATFGTDPSSDGSGYKHIKVLPDATWMPAVDVIDRPGLVKDLTRQAHAIGAKGGQLNFKLELKGSGTAAGSAVQAIASEADPILEAAFGTVTRGTGDLVQAGTTASVIKVVTGANFSKYMMILLTYNGKTYARFITSISSNDLTLDRALPGVPANGSTVQASTRYTRANTGHKSLSFVGQRHDVEYMFNGCKLDSVKVAGMTARGTAILEVVCSVSDWSTSAKASLPSAALTGITAVKAPVVKGAPCAIGGTEEYVYSLDFDPGCNFQFQDSTAGTTLAGGDGVNAGVELVDATPGGSVKPYYAAGHTTDYAAGTERSLAFSAHNGAADGWGLYVPKMQYTAVQPEDHSGMYGEGVPFMVNDNGTDPEFALNVF